MQFVPLHLARALWDATPEHNWSALFDRVQERLDQGPAPQEVNPTTLEQSIRTLAHRGVQYPASPEALAGVLNEQVRASTI